MVLVMQYHNGAAMGFVVTNSRRKLLAAVGISEDTARAFLWLVYRALVCGILY